MTAPVLSVIMPTYNGAALVAATLATLKAQHFSDFEVIIVDDCSRDDTVAVVRACDDARITLIEAEVNQGPVRTRNRAFAAARGRYIAALDQDDLCHPDRFARQVAYLDDHPACVLVAAAASILEDNLLTPSRLPPVSTPDYLDWQMLVRNPIVWSSVMFRADAARRLSPFTRPELLYVEDFDLYHRLRPFGHIARIDEELLIYRSHSGGASQRFHDTMIANIPKVLAEAYRPVFGDDALGHATLIARHLMAKIPVESVGDLEILFGLVGRLRHWFLASRALDSQTRALIDADYACIWTQTARIAVRAGHVGLSEAIDVRPDDLPLTGELSTDLMVSSLVGRVRSMRKRFSGPERAAQ